MICSGDGASRSARTARGSSACLPTLSNEAVGHAAAQVVARGEGARLAARPQRVAADGVLQTAAARSRSCDSGSDGPAAERLRLGPRLEDQLMPSSSAPALGRVQVVGQRLVRVPRRRPTTRPPAPSVEHRDLFATRTDCSAGRSGRAARSYLLQMAARNAAETIATGVRSRNSDARDAHQSKPSSSTNSSARSCRDSPSARVGLVDADGTGHSDGRGCLPVSARSKTRPSWPGRSSRRTLNEQARRPRTSAPRFAENSLIVAE